jgi:capsular exopolysaccharide synthesis family protein
MHLTSPIAGEGKTTTATSIAITFAQAGGKVLLIDADLRVPSLHQVFGLSNALGLTNYLAGDTKPADIAQPTEVAGLFTVTSGPLPPNPVELLASAKMMDLLSLSSERFDYVILDGPPVIGLADAIVLSKLAQGTILVVDDGRTRYGALEGAIKRLRAANAPVLGAVIDRYGRAGKGYGYGYSYDYHYRYDYGVGDAPAALPEKA